MRTTLLETLAACLGLLSLIGVAHARTRDFDIPKGDLKTALDAYSRQAGVQVIYRFDDVHGAMTAGVHGARDEFDALKAILAKTGFEIRRDASGAVAIVKAAPSAKVEHAKVRVDRDLGVERTLDTVGVTAELLGLAATRVPTELREIPQSVSVVSQETLRQQNAQNLSDAMNWITGIRVAGTDSNPQYSARGFGIEAIHVDGGAPIAVATPLQLISYRDLSEFDHIEVLRGADALFGGAGQPSATVNLVRKQPLAQAAAGVTVSTGSWDNHHVEADATGPLGFDGALRGRVVAVADDQGYFYDGAYRRLMKVYGVADYDLLENTRLIVGGSIEQTDWLPNNDSLPRYNSGTDAHLPRSTAYLFPWTQTATANSEWFAKAEQRFNENWKLGFNAAQFKQTQDGIAASASSPISLLTNRMTESPTAQLNHAVNTQRTAELTLTGAFDWNGRPQEVLAGLDYSGGNLTEFSDILDVSGPPVNPFAFDPGAYPFPAKTGFVGIYDIHLIQYGFYAALRLHPWEDISLVAGARDNYLRNVVYSGFGYASPSEMAAKNEYTNTGVLTPYVGVTRDLNERYSVYASYADVFTPNGAFTKADGSAIGPILGANLEAGIKAAWNQGRLNGSLALFKIEQSNNAIRDPDHPGNTPTCCYLGVSNHAKGLDAEISGFAAPGWLLSAGYTFNVGRDYLGGTLNSATPRHLLKIWSSYRLPGVWERWSLGGGLTAQTSSYVAEGTCPVLDGGTAQCAGAAAADRITQGFYAVVSLRAEYRFNSHWRAAVSVNNLFDRTYYQEVAARYGPPRNLMLSVNGSM